MHGKCERLCVCSLGVSLGIIWALSAFIMGLVAAKTGYGAIFVKLIGTVYLGYKATLVGSLIGAVWAFFDAFIFGLLLAFLYNFFAGCCCKCTKD